MLTVPQLSKSSCRLWPFNVSSGGYVTWKKHLADLDETVIFSQGP